MWESEELMEERIDWNRPPKEGDGAWHIRIELIDPDGEKFIKTFQSIPTTKKLSEKENSSEIIDLDHTTSVIDHYLGGMVLGKSFVKESRLVYDKDEGAVIFDKEKPESSYDFHMDDSWMTI
ncbi:hypothetical protein Tco_0001521 [Tanacetum coccineum]